MDPHRSTAPAEDVPAARRAAPAFAWQPTGHQPEATHRRSTRGRPSARRALVAAVALGLALAGAAAASPLVDRDADAMVAVASTQRDRASVLPAPAPQVTVPATTAPVEVPAPTRARVRVAGAVGRLQVRLSAPVRGPVRWVLRGPQGRVRDRRTLTIGPRGVALVVRRLVPGRYRWQVVPTRSGPVRRGSVRVAAPQPIAPPVTAPVTRPVTTPATPATPPVPDSPSTSNPRPPDRPSGGQSHHHHPAPLPQHDPADDIDPADIPDPVDPNP